MRKILSALGAVLVLGMTSVWLMGAVPSPPSPACAEASQLLSCLQSLVGSMNSTGPTGINPNTMATFTNFRNILDNGAGVIQQRGTGAVTCGTTSGIPRVTGYGADRWGCVVNVGSGAGVMTPGTTSSPAPPVGFQFSQKLVRNSGSASLVQPVCAWQEVRTADVVPLQGQTVTFSVYVQALAGLAADNSNAFNLVIVTGTGTDEGLQSFTASPAITPAFTGVATLANAAFTASASAWGRVSTTAAIASTVNELALGVCFTPTTSGTPGATDGLAFTGAQFEVGSTPSAYETRPANVELAKAQTFYYQAAETNGTVFGAGMCQATNVPKIAYPMPAQFWRASQTNVWTVGGFSLSLAGAAATAATGGAIATTLPASFLEFTFTNTCTAGGTATLVGTNTTGLIQASADF